MTDLERLQKAYNLVVEVHKNNRPEQTIDVEDFENGMDNRSDNDRVKDEMIANCIQAQGKINRLRELIKDLQ